jgi:hypothetical protein
MPTNWTTITGRLEQRWHAEQATWSMQPMCRSWWWLSWALHLMSLRFLTFTAEMHTISNHTNNISSVLMLRLLTPFFDEDMYAIVVWYSIIIWRTCYVLLNIVISSALYEWQKNVLKLSDNHTLLCLWNFVKCIS